MATTTFGVDDPDTANLSSYPILTFTPAVDDLIVVWADYSGSLAPAATFAATDDRAGTYTLIDTAIRNSVHTLCLLVRDQLVTSAVGHIVTVTCTGDAATGNITAIYRVAGMSRTGADAIRQTAKEDNLLGSATPAPVFASAALTGNVTLGAASNTTNPATMTPPSSWTEGQDSGHATPDHGLETVFRDSGFTGSTITWGSTLGTVGCDMIAELDTSAVATDRVVDRSVRVTPAVHQAARL